MLEYTLRYPPTPITDEQIAEFEQTLHLRLPSDFKRFLKKWNGGDFACHDEFRIFDFTDPSNIGVDKDVVEWFIDDEDFPDVDPDSVDVLWFGDDGSEGWFYLMIKKRILSATGCSRPARGIWISAWTAFPPFWTSGS